VGWWKAMIDILRFLADRSGSPKCDDNLQLTPTNSAAFGVTGVTDTVFPKFIPAFFAIISSIHTVLDFVDVAQTFVHVFLFPSIIM